MKCRASFNWGPGWWLSGLLLFTSVLPAAAQDTAHQDAATHPDAVAHADASRKVVKKVDAQYPSALKHRGIGGTVRLKVYIKADGTVRDTEVVGGSPALADAAQKAVAQWRFTPGAAESTMEVSIVFDPNS